MVIDIRVVIEVPEKDQHNFPNAIEKILETVKAEFPELKTYKKNSPVTVRIKEFRENVDGRKLLD